MIADKLKKDLYICMTPLQVVIAKKIIESESNSKPDFIFFALADTDRFRYYFKSMAALCDESVYWINPKRFPLYVLEIAYKFWGKKYNRVYLSSVDSVHIQYVLSFTKFNEINTFDDGTANIATDSIYHKDAPCRSEVFKRVVRRIAFNKFSSGKIKELSLRHYTLYPSIKNIIKNTVNLDLFSGKMIQGSGEKKKKCIVFLGTVYDEATKNTANKDNLLLLIKNYIASQEVNAVHYLPHPRDELDYFEGVVKYADSRISEEIVAELMQKYDEIDLLGFSSSAQFNLVNIKNLNLIIIKSVLLKDAAISLSDKLKNNAKILDLDNFS